MPNLVVQRNNAFLEGLSSAVLDSQSILDVFVLQNIINLEDAQKLKSNFRTNREIENFLIKNRLTSRDTVNKAYSILLKLPYIGLSNVKIPEQALSIIPSFLAKKYGIIAFNVEEKLLRLAISRPSDLLSGYPVGLSKILESKGLALELFITGESDFKEAFSQYNKKNAEKLLVKQGSLPVINLRNYRIPKQYLEKIPLSYIKKYRLVIFERNVVGDYLIACEQPDSPVTKKVLDYLQKENNVKLEIFATSKDDIDFVINSQKNEAEPEKTESPAAVEDENNQESSNQKETKNTSWPIALDTLFKKSENFTVDSSKESEGTKTTANKVDSSKDSASLPVLDLKKYKMNSACLALLPKELSTKYRLFIIDDKGEEGLKAVTDSFDKSSETVKFIKQQYAVELFLVSKEDFNEVINNYDSILSSQSGKTDKTLDLANFFDQEFSKAEILDASVQKENTQKGPSSEGSSQSMLEGSDIGSILHKDIKTEADLADIVKEGYIPKIVAGVINYALNKKVSDVHIEPQTKTLRVRCRVDGVLVDVIKMPLKLHPPIISRIKIISKLKIDETRIPQDGRFEVSLMNRLADVRVSSLPTVHGEKIVLRILDKNQKILSLEDLGMIGEAFDKTLEAIAKPWGIILSTGPTGSGKSTTLNAVINRLNKPGVNIITLEDPVEYETPGVNQCQVKPDIGFTFASGLRSVLRQDPNIIMVGEIRDGETAGMATHAALTGHLVLSTLHTNDTSGTLPRLINMGIEPFLITSSINLVIAQRLIRRICTKCKEEIKLPDKLIEEIKSELDKIPESNKKDRARIPEQFKFYYGRGCNECSQGYKGRIGLFEVMIMNPEIENLAIERRPATEIKATSIKNGMITMKQDGILKALAGFTTIDEVFQATMEK